MSLKFMRLVLILIPVVSFTMNYWSNSCQVCRTCSSAPDIIVYSEIIILQYIVSEHLTFKYNNL